MSTGTVAAYSESYLTGVPYLTVAEYQTAPTAIELDNLVPGGTAAQQTGVLANVIARASSFADSICFGAGGVLAATLDTEAGIVRANRRGEYRVPTRFAPVQEVRSFAVGDVPGQLTAVDVSAATGAVFVERQAFVVSGSAWSTAPSIGPLQFGLAASPGVEQFATWSYVSGFPNTTLASPAAATSSTLTVTDATGIYPGRTLLKVYDAGSSDEGTTLGEQLSVTAVAGNTLTLATPLQFAHASGVAVSAMPDAIKQAVISLTTYLIKTRGIDALVIDSMEPSHIPGEAGAPGDLALARDLLEPFRVAI